MFCGTLFSSIFQKKLKNYSYKRYKNDRLGLMCFEIMRTVIYFLVDINFPYLYLNCFHVCFHIFYILYTNLDFSVLRIDIIYLFQDFFLRSKNRSLAIFCLFQHFDYYHSYVKHSIINHNISTPLLYIFTHAKK